MAPSNDTLQWFFRKESVAQCFIRDIQTARSAYQDNNFFWHIGTVPFRVVRFVGVVIGIRTYERRSLYFVEDGTDTIQCIYPHPVTKPHSALDKVVQPPDPVKPLCEVGDTVRIVGRVESWRDTRQITLDHLGMLFLLSYINRSYSLWTVNLVPCCPGEEMQHWIETANLHKTYYCKPFTLPPPPSPTSMKLSLDPPKGGGPSVPHAPVLETVPPSAVLPEEEILKLRHPFRLRSKELSKNVFKIYLKNYMDNLSHSSRCSYRQNTHFDPLMSRSIKGFRLSHLRQVPEIATLGKRITHILNTTTSGEHATRLLSVKKLFIWAIKELIKEGTLVIHDGNVWEITDQHISVWRSSRSDDTRISKSGSSSIMKNSTNISRSIEEDLGELSDPPPKEESYIPLSPEILCPSLLNVMKILTKSKGGTSSESARLGFSVREIRHHLNQDMRWEYVGDYIIADTMRLLERKNVIRSVSNERWKLLGRQ